MDALHAQTNLHWDHRLKHAQRKPEADSRTSRTWLATKGCRFAEVNRVSKCASSPANGCRACSSSSPWQNCWKCSVDDLTSEPAVLLRQHDLRATGGPLLCYCLTSIGTWMRSRRDIVNRAAVLPDLVSLQPASMLERGLGFRMISRRTRFKVSFRNPRNPLCNWNGCLNRRRRKRTKKVEKLD